MLSSSPQRVADAAAQQGLTLNIIEYPADVRTAEDAAGAVGCDVAQIVKSMIFSAGDDGLVLALTSGAHRVDSMQLAGALGFESCGRADPDDVRAATGFAIGGVPPFGHASKDGSAARLTSVLDPHLLQFSEVWAAGGTPRHVFPIDPAVLQQITGAVVTPCFE